MKVVYSTKNKILKPCLRIFSIGIACLILGISGLKAKNGEFTKTISETFAVETNTRIEALNKHGDMNIHTWDKNEVKYEVTITVTAKTEADAQEDLEGINVEFTNIPGVVRAETIWEEKEAKKRWSFFDWNSWGSWNGWESGKKIRVDYEVYMPSANVVDFNNKYGNITFPVFDNDAKFTLKYGNMIGERVGGAFSLDSGYGNADVSSIGGESDVYIKYGKLRVNVLQSIDIESKYSKIYLDNLHDIRINSKYDHYELGEVNHISSNGKYDDFEITKANAIEVNSKYSDYYIEELTGEGDFDMEYSDVKVKNMGENFKNLDLQGKYNSFKFYMPPNSSYMVDTESNYTKLNFPDGQLTHQKDGSEEEIKGYVGNENTGNRIRARLKYGSLGVR